MYVKEEGHIDVNPNCITGASLNYFGTDILLSSLAFLKKS